MIFRQPLETGSSLTNYSYSLDPRFSASHAAFFGSQVIFFHIIGHLHPFTQKPSGVPGIDNVLDTECLGGSEGGRHGSIGFLEVFQVLFRILASFITNPQ